MKLSKVIELKGLFSSLIKPEMIFNVFSNYGNIHRIIIYPLQQKALVEFKEKQQARIAVDFLNNIPFLGNNVILTLSEQQEISELQVKRAEKGFFKEEMFVGTDSIFRFQKNKKKISINPPSSTLHISNLQKKVCQKSIFKEIFSRYGDVQTIK